MKCHFKFSYMPEYECLMRQPYITGVFLQTQWSNETNKNTNHVNDFARSNILSRERQGGWFSKATEESICYYLQYRNATGAMSVKQMMRPSWDPRVVVLSIHRAGAPVMRALYHYRGAPVGPNSTTRVRLFTLFSLGYEHG